MELIRIYLYALLNEIWMDKHLSISIGLFQKTAVIFPRPARLPIKLIKNNWQLFKVLYIVINYTWLVWNPFLQTYCVLKTLIRAFIAPKINVKNLTFKKVNLLASHRLIGQLEKVKNKEILPTITIDINGLSSENGINIYQLASIEIIVKSYFYALVIPLIMCKNKIYRDNLLQSYSSYEWLLTYFTLSNIKGIEETWFSNHFDRWAILFDHLYIPQKILIQHGIIEELECPPIKLKSINTIYLIDSSQEMLFRNYACSSNFNFEILSSNFKLQQVYERNTFKVLIVGEVFTHFEKEAEIIASIENMPITIIVKPHPVLPRQAYYKLKKQYTFNLIEDTSIFPEVDIVISYNSTLATEYEQCDITVLYHTENSVEYIYHYISDKIKDKE